MNAMRPQREYLGLPGGVREDCVTELMISQRSKRGDVIKKERFTADITAWSRDRVKIQNPNSKIQGMANWSRKNLKRRYHKHSI